MRYTALAGVLLLAGCGIPSNPEKGPVILLCEGEELIRGGNGEIERNRHREFYRIDGKANEFATWNDSDQSFGVASPGLVVTPTQAAFTRQGPMIAGHMLVRTVKFDRSTGYVTDESLSSSGGGSVTFRGLCKPVQSPASAKKF